VVEDIPEIPVTSLRMTDGGFVITWPGSEEWNYVVEFTPSLVPATWEALPGYDGIPGAVGTMSATDADAAPKTRFYRIRMIR
jgi:hypothetical protein